MYRYWCIPEKDKIMIFFRDPLFTTFEARFTESFKAIEDAFLEAKEAYRKLPFTPYSKVSEDGVISVDLAGTKKENIKVEVTDNLLKVSATRTDFSGKDEKLETTYKLNLKLADVEKIESTYTDGVLRIVIPTLPDKKPFSKTVNVA